MKKMFLLVPSIIIAQLYFNSLCHSYLYNKGAFFTTHGVFCERTVTDSFTTPFMPLAGAKKEFMWRFLPDPQLPIRDTGSGL